MEHQSSGNEFEARIDHDGKITVPSRLVQLYSGKKLHIRIHREEVSIRLRDKDVTEEEIDRISSVQHESHEQVVKFLLSEGALFESPAFKRRAKASDSARGTQR